MTAEATGVPAAVLTPVAAAAIGAAVVGGVVAVAATGVVAAEAVEAIGAVAAEVGVTMLGAVGKQLCPRQPLPDGTVVDLSRSAAVFRFFRTLLGGQPSFWRTRPSLIGIVAGRALSHEDWSLRTRLSRAGPLD